MLCFGRRVSAGKCRCIANGSRVTPRIRIRDQQRKRTCSVTPMGHLCIQPPEGQEANWLAAASRACFAAMWLGRSNEQAIDGQRRAPPL